MSQPQVPQTATGGGWRNAFQNAQGQTVYSENTDGSVNLTGVYFPDGSYLTTANASGSSVTANLSYSASLATVPMSSATGALQDSPIQMLSGNFLLVSQPMVFSYDAPSATQVVGLQLNPTWTVQTGESAVDTVVIGAQPVFTIPSGKTQNGVIGFEANFDTDSSTGGTLNEFLAFRVHSVLNSGGATLGTHIAFCGGTSALPFTVSKGVFVASTYQYGLDVNPSVASCFGTAPICHSTQVSRTAAPTILDGWYTGTGSPNTVVTANIGSIYSNRSGGANTTLYVKESGNGTNTGWVAK